MAKVTPHKRPPRCKICGKDWLSNIAYDEYGEILPLTSVFHRCTQGPNNGFVLHPLEPLPTLDELTADLDDIQKELAMSTHTTVNCDFCQANITEKNRPDLRLETTELVRCVTSSMPFDVCAPCRTTRTIEDVLSLFHERSKKP